MTSHHHTSLPTLSLPHLSSLDSPSIIELIGEASVGKTLSSISTIKNVIKPVELGGLNGSVIILTNPGVSRRYLYELARPTPIPVMLGGGIFRGKKAGKTTEIDQDDSLHTYTDSIEELGQVLYNPGMANFYSFGENEENDKKNEEKNKATKNRVKNLQQNFVPNLSPNELLQYSYRQHISQFTMLPYEPWIHSLFSQYKLSTLLPSPNPPHSHPSSHTQPPLSLPHNSLSRLIKYLSNQTISTFQLSLPQQNPSSLSPHPTHPSPSHQFLSNSLVCPSIRELVWEYSHPQLNNVYSPPSSMVPTTQFTHYGPYYDNIEHFIDHRVRLLLQNFTNIEDYKEIPLHPPQHLSSTLPPDQNNDNSVAFNEMCWETPTTYKIPSEIQATHYLSSAAIHTIETTTQLFDFLTVLADLPKFGEDNNQSYPKNATKNTQNNNNILKHTKTIIPSHTSLTSSLSTNHSILTNTCVSTHQSPIGCFLCDHHDYLRNQFERPTQNTHQNTHQNPNTDDDIDYLTQHANDSSLFRYTINQASQCTVPQPKLLVIDSLPMMLSISMTKPSSDNDIDHGNDVINSAVAELVDVFNKLAKLLKLVLAKHGIHIILVNHVVDIIPPSDNRSIIHRNDVGEDVGMINGHVEDENAGRNDDKNVEKNREIFLKKEKALFSYRFSNQPHQNNILLLPSRLQPRYNKFFQRISHIRVTFLRYQNTTICSGNLFQKNDENYSFGFSKNSKFSKNSIPRATFGRQLLMSDSLGSFAHMMSNNTDSSEFDYDQSEDDDGEINANDNKNSQNSQNSTKNSSKSAKNDSHNDDDSENHTNTTDNDTNDIVSVSDVIKSQKTLKKSQNNPKNDPSRSKQNIITSFSSSAVKRTRSSSLGDVLSSKQGISYKKAKYCVRTQPVTTQTNLFLPTLPQNSHRAPPLEPLFFLIASQTVRYQNVFGNINASQEFFLNFFELYLNCIKKKQIFVQENFLKHVTYSMWRGYNGDNGDEMYQRLCDVSQGLFFGESGAGGNNNNNNNNDNLLNKNNTNNLLIFEASKHHPFFSSLLTEELLLPIYTALHHYIYQLLRYSLGSGVQFCIEYLVPNCHSFENCGNFSQNTNFTSPFSSSDTLLWLLRTGVINTSTNGIMGDEDSGSGESDDENNNNFYHKKNRQNNSQNNYKRCIINPIAGSLGMNPYDLSEKNRFESDPNNIDEFDPNSDNSENVENVENVERLFDKNALDYYHHYQKPSKIHAWIPPKQSKYAQILTLDNNVHNLTASSVRILNLSQGNNHFFDKNVKVFKNSNNYTKIGGSKSTTNTASLYSQCYIITSFGVVLIGLPFIVHKF